MRVKWSLATGFRDEWEVEIPDEEVYDNNGDVDTKVIDQYVADEFRAQVYPEWEIVEG